MAIPVTSVVALALGVALFSCGDSGYSFGHYDEQTRQVAPLVDRYCDRAMECAPYAIAPSLDECRFRLLSEALQLAMECVPPLEALVECADGSSCLGFPVLIGDVGGSCGAELEALGTCANPTATAESGTP